MAKTERIKTGFKDLRLEALISQREVADAIGGSQSFIVMLEGGRGNPRMDTIYAVLIVLARTLKRSPKEVWEAFYLEESCAAYEPISEQARAALTAERTFRGSFKAKRFLRDRTTEGPNRKLPEAADMRRFQELFASSPLTLTELSRITQVSRRRLDLIFTEGSEPSANMALTTFTRLAAAFAPIHDASIKATATYAIARDLEQLTEFV